MAELSGKHGRDHSLDFQGFLSDMQDWELSLKGKDKKFKPHTVVKEKENDVPPSRGGGQAEKAPAADYLKHYDAVNRLSKKFQTDNSFADAASEKEQGNEYYKQKKFKEAIDCYSRSIALSATAVAFANRAMAYLKLRRFQEAEDDCTEALNLDDRYIKAYSRRATARKELGKAKEALEDAEFAQRLEPHNQEIKKQYAEIRSVIGKAILEKAACASSSSTQAVQTVVKSDREAKIQDIHPTSSSTLRTGLPAAQEHIKENGGQRAVKASTTLKEIENRSTGADIKTKSDAVDGFRKDALQSLNVERNRVTRKQELKPSVQELASRAASRSMIEAAKNITVPTTAYQFEVSWRGFSGDCALQARLLKAISPAMLPQIFKNALTAPILIEIVKCVATFFTGEMGLAINFLESLTKVPRFSILMMCLPSSEKSDLLKIWDGVFCDEAVPIEYAEMLDGLRSKYFLKQ